MRISSITKNAGKACNNRLYRHIRTFEKIIKNYFVIYNERLPIFVIAGENDPVIQSKKKFNALIVFLKELGYANISQKLYKNNRHEILNEKNKSNIYKDILNFYEN